MGKMLASALFGFVVIAAAVPSFALQAGGVEVGDLETGSVVGQRFTELPVDAELYSIEIGNMKAWYPPVTVIDFKARGGRPLVLKVTNNSSGEHGFTLTPSLVGQSAPTELKAQVVLKPGESKYIGVPTSDLFYATQGWTLQYKCQLHPAHVGGTLLMVT
jgi:hypothetical protein